jgi:hypothetical protein
LAVTVQDPRLIAAIIYLSARNPDDPVITDPTGQKLLILAAQVTQARAMGMYFDDLNAFADFVQNPMSTITSAINTALGGGATTPATTQPTGPTIEGVELDKQKLAEIAVVGPRRVYRVEVTATVGRVMKRLTAIWDQNTQNQNARDPNYQKGTWVFWREE